MCLTGVAYTIQYEEQTSPVHMCSFCINYMHENKRLKSLGYKLSGLDEILTQLNRCTYMIMNKFLVCMNLIFFPLIPSLLVCNI